MPRTDSNAITQLAEQVAQHLTGDWDVRSFPADWGRRGAFLTEVESGAMLAIGDSQEYSDRGKGRLTVTTDYPKDRSGNQSGARRPKISVSVTKNGAQIASDIERRLLPEYLPLLEKEMASNRAWAQHVETTTTIAKQIAKLVKVPSGSDDPNVSFYNSPVPLFRETMSGARVVDDQGVELTLCLDASTALKVLNLLVNGSFKLPESC